MILYALEAKDNCGKTTTLKKLLLRLLQAGARPLTETDGGRIAAQLAAERSALARGEQYETADVTADAVNLFRDSGCKVCFFAVRSKGAVQAMLNEYARYNTVYRIEQAVLLNAESFPDRFKYTEELNSWQANRLYDFCRSELNA